MCRFRVVKRLSAGPVTASYIDYKNYIEEHELN